MTLCEQCNAQIGDEEWKLVRPMSELQKYHYFCSHLCTFEWLRVTYGDEMTSMVFTRKEAKRTEKHRCSRCGGPLDTIRIDLCFVCARIEQGGAV